MPNMSPNRSADPWLREPTATATPESVSLRSAANELAIPPVPRIPHRTGLSPTSSSLRRVPLPTGTGDQFICRLPAGFSRLRPRERSGDEQAQAELCRVEAGDVAVALGPPA